MRRQLIASVFMILLVNIYVPTISGSYDTATLTYNPTDDTYVNQNQVNGGYKSCGLENNMIVRSRYGGSSWQFFGINALIRFNLSSLPQSIAIADAELYFYYYDYMDNNPKNRNLSVYRLNSDWDENDTMLKTQPKNAGRITANSTVPPTFGWMCWNVTDDIQDYVNNRWNNYGWQITDEGMWGTVNIPTPLFYSKESSTKKPYLKVEYITNYYPTADAGGPYVGYINNSVLFDASNSNDQDGTITGYRWDFDNDSIWDTDWLTAAQISHVYNSTGVYNITLQVKDDYNASTINTTVINISVVPNKPPNANFTFMPNSTNTNIIIFNDSSTDDGEIVSWHWNFGDGNSSSIQNPIHLYNSTGIYVINLTVTDNDGSNDSIEKEIQVYLYRGDINNDGNVNVYDFSNLLNYLLYGRPTSNSLYVMDVNGDGNINMEDLTYFIKHLFM